MTATAKSPSPHAQAVQLGRKAAREKRSAQSNPFKTSGKGYASAWLAGYHSEKKAMREEAGHAA